MKEAYKLKLYSLIEGMESRLNMIDQVATGVKKLSLEETRKLISDNKKLLNSIKEFVDIS